MTYGDFSGKNIVYHDVITNHEMIASDSEGEAVKVEQFIVIPYF